MTKQLCPRLVGVILCVLLTRTVDAQENPSSAPADSVPTFRTQTREVLVDVIVADKNGQFVPGLKIEDFTVEEDHRPQRISGFSLHRYQPPNPVSYPPLPPNQYSNFTQLEPGGAVSILMLDTLNTPPLEQAYARKAMVEFLRRLPPGQKVGLFILSDRPRLIQGFTSSSDVLIAAGKSLAPDLSLIRAENTLAGPIGQSLGPGSSGLVSRSGMTADLRFKLTLTTLNALARSVSGYSGRKNLLWLSGHFPFRLDEYFVMNNRAGFGGAYSSDIRETASLLAAAQVAVYPVDVKGLGDAEDTFAMEDLARETGGKAFFGNNAVGDALLHGLQQGSDYYTLAYSPENHQWNGQYRKIEVKVALKDAKLTFRRGYYAMAEKPFTGDEAAKALATAMQPLMPVSTMLLVRAQVLPPDSEHSTVRIDYAVDAHDISFNDSPDQRKHASVDFMSVAWDGEFKNAGYATDSVAANFPPQAYTQVMQTGFPGHQELTLKPGTYNLRLGVIDRGSQKIGTIDLPLTIPATEPAKK